MIVVAFENACYFGNGLRIVLRAMIRGNDELRLRAIKVRAPVWDYTVGTIGSVASSAVSHDRMVWNTGGNRKFIDRLNEPIVRFESIHTVRHSIQRPGGRVRD